MSGHKKSQKPSEWLVGIDFGTTKIGVVIGKKTVNGTEVVGIGKQVSHGIRKGMVVNISATVDALKKAIEVAELMAGTKITSAYCGIAGSHIKGFNSTGVVAVKNREVTEQDVERSIDAAKAVAIPLDREVLHVIPQEFSINDQDGVKDPIGMLGVRLESKVHIVTGAVASTQNIIKCANLAGITVTDMVLEPLASAEAVLTQDEKELGAVLIDIGGGTTDVAVFVRGSVVYTGVVPMGGNHITNDIAVGLRTSIQDAENIKIQSGCAMSSLLSEDKLIDVPMVGGKKSREVSKAVLTKIIEPRVEEIFTLVSQEIAASGYKHMLSTGAVLTGGASLLDGLPELAEFILEMPVRHGVPEGIGGLTDVVSSPIYSTAVGLLLLGSKNQKEVSYVPHDNKYSKAISKMKNWLGDVF